MLNMLMKYKITMSLCKIGDWWKQSIEFENWYFIGQNGNVFEIASFTQSKCVRTSALAKLKNREHICFPLETTKK